MEQTHNGGFPEPLPGEPVRQVRCTHDVCGADTRVRIPFALSAEAVRRVVCEECGQVYEADGVVDEAAVEPAAALAAEPAAAVGAERSATVAAEPAPSEAGAGAPPSGVPGWLSNPDSRVWRYLSIPVAAAAVIGALALIQGC